MPSIIACGETDCQFIRISLVIRLAPHIWTGGILLPLFDVQNLLTRFCIYRMLIRSIRIRSNRIDRAVRLESGSMMMQRRAPGSPVGFTLYCLYISVINFMKHVIRFSGSIAATSLSKQPNVGPISTSATCVYPCCFAYVSTRL
jgi:hypothetical protein